MTGAEILVGLGRTYASAQAYRDVGRVIFPHRGQRGDQATIGEFRTAFLRSRGFRFEYREVATTTQVRDPSAHRGYGIRVERGKIVDIHGFESPPDSIHLAVASMTGITFGAAHVALRMLLPGEIGGRTLSEARSAKLVRSDSIDGRTRFVIHLEGRSTDELIIDEGFALRRVRMVVPEAPAGPTTGAAQSRFVRVLAYDPELFAEEPPDLTLDW